MQVYGNSARAAREPAWLVGSNVSNRYTVESHVATGEFFEVYKGFLEGAEQFRRPVVIKRIRRDLASDSRVVGAVIHHARRVAALSHANALSVLDLGRDAAGPFIVQEFVDGARLDELVVSARRNGSSLSVPMAIFVTAEVLEALGRAHAMTDLEGRAASLIHGDVCAANVLISRDGQVKLANFGLTTGRPTPNFGPGAHPGRGDLYSAAALLYTLLTGSPPDTENPAPPSSRAPGLPIAVDAVLLDLLSSEATPKFADAEDMMLGLLRAIAPQFRPTTSRDLAALVARVWSPAGAEANESRDGPARDDTDWKLGDQPTAPQASESTWAIGDAITEPGEQSRTALRAGTLRAFGTSLFGVAVIAAGAWYCLQTF